VPVVATRFARSASRRHYGKLGKRNRIVACYETEKRLQAVMIKSKSAVPVEQITRMILILRAQRVILDRELASLYGVTTKAFNQAVKRNIKRFPMDFLFQLNAHEANSLRSQFVTLKRGRGRHPKYLPFAFTEHGAIMAATILNSPRAVEMSLYVVRAFVQMRELLSSSKELARRFAELEMRLNKGLAEHDEAITAILSAIRQLMNSPTPQRRGIGFTADLEPKA
jgi:ORF6N domain